MDAKFVALFLAFLSIFAANNSEGNRKLAESWLQIGVICDLQKLDTDTATQVWNYCTREEDCIAAANDLDFNLTQKITSSPPGRNFGRNVSVRKILQNSIGDLKPDGKEIILSCLREKLHMLLALRAEQEVVPIKHPVLDCIPRRYLKGKRIYNQNFMTAAPDPGPASSPASFATIGIRQVHAPSPSPSPSPLPSPSPSPSPSASPSPSPSPAPFFNPVAETPEQAPASSPPSSHTNRNSASSKDYAPISSPGISDKTKFTIAVAIAISVAGLLCLALLLILCMQKGRVEPNDGQRDEKPLLNFSLSDFSAGSSHKTDTAVKDFKASSVAGSSLDGNCGSSVAESQLTGASEGKTAILPLPPGRTAPPPPPGPPPPPPKPPAPAPPPPPKAVRRPPNPPLPSKPSPLGPHRRHSSTGDANEVSDESDVPKTKLKPFFWDKVLASPDHSMVWHEIKAGSFQFNEEMMESLFGYATADKNKNEHRKDSPSTDSPSHFIQIIDPKKSQNLAILLKALNVTTEEVCDALQEGNELPSELIQTLLKMAPTTDEELKLRLYDGDVTHLGPAERFLKVMVNIPFAFKRLEALLFLSRFQEEFPSIKESFATLEVACEELRNSRLFLKLLEAVLKTGNRMNDGTYRGGAKAFKLDTLLKLADVKGTDGKTTLLHFVVQEIIKSEGVRAARRLRESQSMSSLKTEDLADDSSHEMEEYHRSLGLQVVSGLSSELQNVKKAAIIDNEDLSDTISKLRHLLAKTKAFLEKEMKEMEGEIDFHGTLTNFVRECESDMEWLIGEESRIMALMKSTGDYFHGKAGRDEGSHLFVIVRDFLLMLDKSCLDLKNSPKLAPRMPRKDVPTSSSTPTQDSPTESSMDIHRRLFPAMRAREMDEDDEDEDFCRDKES